MFPGAGVGQAIAEVQLGRMPSAFAEAGESAHRDPTCRIGDRNDLDCCAFYKVFKEPIGTFV